MIQVHEITHSFKNGKVALKGISCQFRQDGLTAIIGPSGAGKSTLLRCLNGLIQPSLGEVRVDGTCITLLRGQALREQQRKMGMVFQQFNLIRRKTALENVLNGRLGYDSILKSAFGLHRKEEQQKAMHLLDRVGLVDFAGQRVSELSGGQQQRVAIARALMQDPHVILADEPVSALDPRSTEQVMQILSDIHVQDGIQIILNLHDLHVVKAYTHHVLALKDGQVLFEAPCSHLTDDLIHQLYYGKEHELVLPQGRSVAFA